MNRLTVFSICFAVAYAGSMVLPSAQSEPPTLTYIGMCDASAAVPVTDDLFAVADDEDNIIRVFHQQGGEAVLEFDASRFLGNNGVKKPKEADLEAATQIGKYTFWITSHGRNSKGKNQPERQRLFATELHTGKLAITPFGKPYTKLVEDLVAHPDLKKFGVKQASLLAPKAPGALNIEGLAATPEGHLLVGFRNPIPGGLALVVRLLNPMEVVQGGVAKLGKVTQLDLNGNGIRSFERCGNRYLIVAGNAGEGGKSQLFEWNGKDKPKAIYSEQLNDLNVEGIVLRSGARDVFLALSDDGSRLVDGTPGKKLKDPKMKTFRGRLIQL